MRRPSLNVFIHVSCSRCVCIPRSGFWSFKFFMMYFSQSASDACICISGNMPLAQPVKFLSGQRRLKSLGLCRCFQRADLGRLKVIPLLLQIRQSDAEYRRQSIPSLCQRGGGWVTTDFLGLRPCCRGLKELRYAYVYTVFATFLYESNQ